MLGAAIIVFRESLEAALLIGIVAAAARTLPRRNRWIGGGIAAGIAGSLWDTSDFLAGNSAVGTLLHVLAGYDPRPCAMQLIFYVGTIPTIASGMYLARMPAPSRLGTPH